jgi:hypothetical protein
VTSGTGLVPDSGMTVAASDRSLDDGDTDDEGSNGVRSSLLSDRLISN